MVERKTKLTDKQRRFAWEYCVDQNGTQAAIRAGYSPRGADVASVRLLRNASVKNIIDERLIEIAERTRVDAEKVRKELARLAFTDMKNFVKWGPDGVELLPCEELSDDDSPAVTEVTQSPGQYGDTLKIKLGHKDSSLRILAEHTGLVGKDNGVNVNVSVNQKPTRDLSEMTSEELEFYERLLAPTEQSERAEP